MSAPTGDVVEAVGIRAGMNGHSHRSRVLYCESNIDGTIGGSHYCLLYLVENLDRSEFEPTVIFYDNHALVPRFRAAAETLVCEPDAPVRWAAPAVGGGPGWLKVPMVLARRAVNAAKLVWTIGEHVAFLRRRGIDLVHLNNSITRHLDWSIAAFIAGVPCVVHERGLNARYSAVHRACARRFALIIPMSKWIRDHMVERGVSPGNIRVIYDGLDPDRLQVTVPEADLRRAWDVRPEQPVVGIVGNIREWKGQNTVVRALIDVVKARPDLVCFFVGAATASDQPFVDSLRKLIADAGIEKNVRFTGYQKEVPSFINMMEFVLHASTQPEPFGMVVLEAMAQRKAVIGSRAGGVIEMVVESETGYTFPPSDSRTLAERMKELLGNPELCRQMGESGYRRLISSFTQQQYMREIHAAYRAILGRRAAVAEVGFAADTQAR